MKNLKHIILILLVYSSFCLDAIAQEREEEIEKLKVKIADKKEEYNILSDRVKNYDEGIKELKDLRSEFDNSPEYQLPEP